MSNARPARPSASSAGAGTSRESTGKVAAARDRLVRGVLSPLNAVLLTRKHIEEVLDDAVAAVA